MGQIKVAFGGPPHSGKTVLLGLFRSLLPRDKFVAIEAAPDGEGITGWSSQGDAELVRAIRRKGKFSRAHVDWMVQSVRSSTMPITLVDLGGMMLDSEGGFSPTGENLTPENERMLRECTHLIVLSNPGYFAEAVPNWTAEAKRLGVETMAILTSVLTGADDEIFDEGFPLKARVTKLEREDPPVGSPTARAVADRMLELAGESDQFDGSDEADVNFPQLAEELEIDDWTPEVLPRLTAAVSERVSEQLEVKLWGNTSTGNVYHALACALEVRVRYYDPKIPGYVPLPPLQPQSEGGEVLDWRVEVRSDHTLVHFVIPRQIFDVFDLPMVIPPTVPTGKGVVLSGKGPRWLMGAIARAYCCAGARWVAVFSPIESGRILDDDRKWAEHFPNQGPAVVVGSSDKQVPMGTVVPFPLMGED